MYYMKAKANHIVGVWCKRHLRLLYRNNFFNLMVWKKLPSVVPSLWLLCGLASKEFYALHNIRVAHFWFYSSVSETESHKIHFVLFWILQKFRSNWRSFRPILEKNAFNKFNVNNISFLKLCKIWKSDIVWFFGQPYTTFGLFARDMTGNFKNS